MASYDEIINFTICIFMFVVGVPGNLLILIFFTTRSRLSKISLHHLLISLLALPDLLVCLGYTTMKFGKIDFQADWRNEKVVNDNNKWVLGEMTCEYYKTFPIHVAPAISAWTLVGLSFERYWKITRPFHKPVKKKLVLLIIALLWFSAYCVTLPMTLSAVYDPVNLHCLNGEEKLPVGIHHLLVQSLLIECIIPCFFIFYLYTKLKKFLLLEETTTTLSSCNERNNNLAIERRIKSIQTVKWLFILFLATMLPGRIVHASRIILSLQKAWTSDHYTEITLNIFQKCIYLNNTINIFIYSWKNREFRGFVLRFFFKCCSRYNGN